MRRAARTDATARNLIAAAKHLGLGYVPLNGIIDGLLFRGETVAIVDWKSTEAATLTEGQGRLLAAGCPIHFVSTIPQLELLAAKMRWDERRRYEDHR